MNLDAALERAVELARRGRFDVEPNPRVGCVLLRDGERIGEGWHRAFGGPHAEIEALSDVGGEARGATAVVTLEPCSTRGKTGACTEALLRAGVVAVVVGAVDPNPEHAGRGLEMLRAQGLQVELRESRACQELLAPFLAALGGRRPHVLAKWAQSADGAVARLDEGLSVPTALSGPEAAVRTHAWRAHADGILVGVGTVVADDPRLDVRQGQTPVRPLRRVVLDPQLRTPPHAQLASTTGLLPSWILCTADAPDAREETLREQGCEVFRLPSDDDLLPSALHLLRAQGLHRVLVEGGPRTHAALLGHGLVDDLAIFLCPSRLGADALAALPGERLSCEPEALAARFDLREWRVEPLGEDRLVLGRPARA